MSYFYIARDRGDNHYFEVCDADPGRCPHAPGNPEHRTYTWSLNLSDGPGAPGELSVDQMVGEIRLLEALLKKTPDPGISLDQEGKPVDG